MAGEKSTGVLKGCIKGVKGPWLVHRTTKDGRAITRLRFPSDRERQNNKRRERERRFVTRKIFSGIRAHGNYHLPKHADTNDLLKALCAEAGWNVDEDGNVSRKDLVLQGPSVIKTQACQVRLDRLYEDQEEDYCKCNNNWSLATTLGFQSRTISEMLQMHHHDGYEVDLSLSLLPRNMET